MDDGVHKRTLEAAFSRFQQGASSPLELYRDLFDTIRPDSPDDAVTASQRYRLLLDFLSARPELCAVARSALLQLFVSSKQRSFFAESGLLPGTGFFTELWRKFTVRLLPEVRDPYSLRDAVTLVFHDRNDYRWLEQVPEEHALKFWHLLDMREVRDDPAMLRMLGEILDALQSVSYRITATGLDAELAHAWPQIEKGESPFIAQNVELQALIKAYQHCLSDPQAPAVDEKHLLVLIDQCRETVKKVQNAALTAGTSLRLNFMLVRLTQHLDRLDTLIQLIAARYHDHPGEALMRSWAVLIRSAICGEISRSSIRRHFSDLFGLLAVRVTKNASRTGDHYITTDRRGYFGMWGSAMGAGVIVGFMALIKILTAKLHLPPLIEGLAFSLNYALGFIFVHMLHFTIATKQPAMTAAAIAETVREAGGRLREIERLGQLVIDVMRSQFAAICGNVLVAFPVALGIALWLSHANLNPVPPEKAAALLQDLSPLRSLALLHAAIAGVWLFVSGLISGYFDNKAAYDRIGLRVAGLTWLRRLVGEQRAKTLGSYIDRNLGGLAGNFFFGFMLGMTGTFGHLLGLPLDIRHITFSTANLAYGAVGLEFAMSAGLWLHCILGVALIGIINLTVSFALALWTALRAHGVRITHAGALLRYVSRQFVVSPMQFFYPPNKTADTER